MDNPKNTIGRAQQSRIDAEVEFASRMKDLESALNDLVNMSYLATATLEGLECGKGPNGQDIVKFASGEDEAFFFSVYEVDKRARQLHRDYYAAYDVFKSGSGQQAGA